MSRANDGGGTQRGKGSGVGGETRGHSRRIWQLRLAIGGNVSGDANDGFRLDSDICARCPDQPGRALLSGYDTDTSLAS